MVTCEIHQESIMFWFVRSWLTPGVDPFCKLGEGGASDILSTSLIGVASARKNLAYGEILNRNAVSSFE